MDAKAAKVYGVDYGVGTASTCRFFVLTVLYVVSCIGTLCCNF